MKYFFAVNKKKNFALQTRHLFLPDVDPGYFLQYCCPWLLPALLINENSSDLNWVAKV